MKDSNDLLKCRLCFDTCDEMFELFANDTKSKAHRKLKEKSALKLSEKIENCCGVRIRKSPQMPSKICLKCFDITYHLSNFRQMILNSQVYLESLCKDRKIPTEVAADETKYINYLMQELQLIKTNINYTNLNDFNDDDDEDKMIYSNDVENLNIKCEFEELLAEYESEDDIFDSAENYETILGLEKNASIKREISKTADAQKKKKKQKTPTPKYLKKYFRPPSPTSYMCTVCGNTYQKRSTFQYHMAIHSDVKPHQCEICNKQFRHVSDLKNHMRRHTGERPYQCSYCERRFIDRSEKHRHERVHTNTRPYKCKVCEKTFSYSTTLKNHSKLHSGEKDFNCLVCNKSFSLQHQLKAHLQTTTHKQAESKYVAAGYEVVYE